MKIRATLKQADAGETICIWEQQLSEKDSIAKAMRRFGSRFQEWYDREPDFYSFSVEIE